MNRATATRSLLRAMVTDVHVDRESLWESANPYAHLKGGGLKTWKPDRPDRPAAPARQKLGPHFNLKGNLVTSFSTTLTAMDAQHFKNPNAAEILPPIASPEKLGTQNLTQFDDGERVPLSMQSMAAKVVALYM